MDYVGVGGGSLTTRALEVESCLSLEEEEEGKLGTLRDSKHGKDLMFHCWF